MKKYLKHFQADLSASIVVYLVALPLCLGIALGSTAPLFSGIIAGVIGGIVVGILSGSQLSVSGPAAGLTSIVAASILNLNSYEVFLLALVIAGCIQVLLGYLKAGIIGDYIPNAVIKGMLAAIGIILILKQFPHLVGYDKDYLGDENFIQPDNENTFSEIIKSLNYFSVGAIFIGLISILILILFESKSIKRNKILQNVPGPLVVVLFSILLHQIFIQYLPDFVIEKNKMVSLPIAGSLQEFYNFFTTPDFKSFTNLGVWTTALTIALVASLETLLSIEAVDKLDPNKRVTPTDRELKAQGAGNIVSGMLGGLPMTSVIVRSSANVNAGAQTKVSAILHGILLLLSVIFIPYLINQIPLSSLAAILIYTGYKLAKVPLFVEHYKKGLDQFIPFCITILSILFSDLLIGIGIGILTGIFFILRTNFKSSVLLIKDNDHYMIRLRKDVSFLNKPIIKNKLEEIPEHSFLIIDASKTAFIDKDVIDVIREFKKQSVIKNIKVDLKTNPNNSFHSLLLN
ncbi:MAG: hypothetical protein RL634_1072 [Bacteroidota bacterium]|jgi:MFS superfamily sulfate permease-like transporter